MVDDGMQRARQFNALIDYDALLSACSENVTTFLLGVPPPKVCLMRIIPPFLEYL